MAHIYGIGETVYDIIFRNAQPQRAVPGGSTFNSLISLGRCGLHPTMVTEIGDDYVGKTILQFMQQNGVLTNYVNIHSGSKTPVSLAFLNNQNDAHYQFYKDPSAPVLERRFPDFKADDLVLFGSFFSVNPALRSYTREFLQRAHDAGCTLYYDVNFRAAHKDDLPQVLDNIEENMRLATIVRGSTEDFECIYGETDAQTIYSKFVSPLCSRFICTDGGKDVRLFFGNSQLCCDIPPIKTISTIGAGDNFNAGIIYSLYISRARENVKNIDKEEKQFQEKEKQFQEKKVQLHEEKMELCDEEIRLLIKNASSFASRVCQSFDNYVDCSFAAEKIRQQLFTKQAFLFDLDGVIIDTEGLYQEFWGAIGREFLPAIPDFATRIKGSTLVAIHNNYFAHDAALRDEIDRRLIAYEDQMQYRLFEGALNFVEMARRQGIRCAIVTSSNQKKMESLAQQLPELTSHFDHVFTAEDAGRGKPFPDCYLRAAAHFQLSPEQCVVFEDSMNGLKAARSSGSFVVGLTTTHPLSQVATCADVTVESLLDLVP